MNHDSQIEPPQSPAFKRKLRFYNFQYIGLPLIFLIPALAIFGIFDSSLSNYTETVLRVIFIYLLILIGLRIMGKREFGQLSPLELVALLLIPELVSPALTRDDLSLTNALIAVCTLFAVVFLTSVARYLFETFEKAISGDPCILVSHGKFIEDNLHKERVDPAEIFSEMHKYGLHELKQVRWAILETDGKIAIVAEPDPHGSINPEIDNKAVS